MTCTPPRSNKMKQYKPVSAVVTTPSTAAPTASPIASKDIEPPTPPALDPVVLFRFISFAAKVPYTVRDNKISGKEEEGKRYTLRTFAESNGWLL